jgi:hypothetical protein
MTHTHFTRTASRRGLSTVEFVLALPILMMVMALMVNFGTIASWKVRGLVVARNEAFANRWPHSGFPRPWYWPASATASHGDSADIAELDDPRARQPVIRGPIPLGTTVNGDLLNPSRGMFRGDAQQQRRFPLLQSMGTYTTRASNELLGSLWNWEQMNWPAIEQFGYHPSLWYNDDRRIPVLYILPTVTDPSYRNAYREALIAIYWSPSRRALFPIDLDFEYVRLGLQLGASVFSGYVPPDFTPTPNSFCSLDDAVAKLETDALQERVKNVPREMTQSLIALHERAVRALNLLLNATPAPPADQQASIRAQIGQLENANKSLQDFIDYLNSLP